MHTERSSRVCLNLVIFHSSCFHTLLIFPNSKHPSLTDIAYCTSHYPDALLRGFAYIAALYLSSKQSSETVVLVEGSDNSRRTGKLRPARARARIIFAIRVLFGSLLTLHSQATTFNRSIPFLGEGIHCSAPCRRAALSPTK